MKIQVLLVLYIATVLGSGCATPVATLSAYEGLVPVQSAQLDELLLRPNAEMSGYRAIMVDPVQVEFRDDWLKNMNRTRHAVRWLGKDDTRRLAEQAAASLQDIVAETFKAQGYELVAAPGSGVLRLSPSATDLYVNAPDRPSPWRTKTFTRDAGQVTLLLEAHDAVSGTLLGRVVHLGRAREMGGLTMASEVSNRFWFEALFRRWAVNCVTEMKAGKNRP